MTTTRPLPRSASRPPAIAAVIFDLDDTLYDCFHQRVQKTHRYASRAMHEAGLPASTEAIFRVRWKAFRDDPRLDHIERAVCRHFGVRGREAERICRAAHAAYFSAPVGRLTLFPGARSLLRWLHRNGARVFVVSYGEPRIQRAKVRALGLGKERAIEKIYFADRAKVLTKPDIFRIILERVKLPPARVLVIGDRPSSEIVAGKKLGMRTVRLRHGEFSRLEAKNRQERADFEVRKIASVRRLPFRFSEP